MKHSRIIAIDFQYCWLTLKKSLKWGILSAVIAFMISLPVVDNYTMEGSYRATATLYSFPLSDAGSTSVGLETLQRYSEIIKSRRIASGVADVLGDPVLNADKIYEMISTEPRYMYTTTVRYNNDLTVIPIYADSADSEQSIAVANAAADVFASEINSLLGGDVIQVLDYAYTTESDEITDSMRMILSIAAAVLMGGFIIICFIMRTIFSSNVQTMTDLSFYGQIPILGVLPEKHK